jgi:nucleoside 2-deoxyribosyltransferase
MSIHQPRAYLAGPDVFRPDAAAVGERKKALCQAHGLQGLFPLDGEADPAQDRVATGLAIFRANVSLILSCDLVIAEMTPFRGPSMDVGTAFEIGFAHALGLPVFGYSADVRPYVERVAEWNGRPVVGVDDTLRDRDGLIVEDFGMAENLMIWGALVAPLSPSFETAVIAAARLIGTSRE